jgi:iron complex outermembrane receptor protein
MSRLATFGLRKFAACGLCAIAAFGATDVMAQAAGGAKTSASSQATLEEVIVTAEKRAENVNTVPISITALSADDLATKQVSSLADLGAVAPGVINGNLQGQNRLFIRGIGLNSIATGADGSSAFNVDEIYVARPAEQLMSFFDVERVEVLRGPQGTLYGRNATGGSVNVFSRRPTDTFSGYLTASLGNYSKVDLDGAASGPLTADGRLTGRIAFQTAAHNGYGRNIVVDGRGTGIDGFGNRNPIDDEHRQAIRGTLQFKATDNVDATLIAEYGREDDHNFAQHGFGSDPLAAQFGFVNFGCAIYGATCLFNSRDVANESTNVFRTSLIAVTGIVDVKINDSLAFKSITGYRKFFTFHDLDAETSTYPSGPVSYDTNSKQISEELQLLYTSDKLKGVMGLYYYDEKLRSRVYAGFQEQNLALPPDTLFLPFYYEEFGESHIKAWAPFTQWTYSITPGFRATAGIRYSHESRDNIGAFHGVGPPPVPLNQEKSWSDTSPKVGLDFDLAEGVMVYASYGKGFKSGIFNVGQENPPINPEKVKAVEVGLKGQFFDKRLETTVALFSSKYTDLQVNKIIGIGTQTVNAAKAKIKGAEFAMRAAVTENFLVNADFTYLDAKFEEFFSLHPVDVAVNPLAADRNLAGNQLPGAPKTAVNVGLEYRFPFSSGASITPRIDVNHRSRVHYSEFNELAQSQDAVTKANATIRYTPANDRWYLMAWGKNITNKTILSSTSRSIALWGFPMAGTYEPPATYGLTLNVKF